ncbi:MAG: hypothetical protein LBP74_01755 [Treponema sp.]|nr:hypothetical protein [Treponema sp.]
MKTSEKVLIVTDGVDSTCKMAEEIRAVLEGKNVVVRTAADFSGTDILSAGICFFGCEAPRPRSFAYLERLLKHINLAGRSCGVFSPGSQEAAAYLSDMVHDSELALCPEPLFARPDIAGWVKKVIGS